MLSQGTGWTEMHLSFILRTLGHFGRNNFQTGRVRRIPFNMVTQKGSRFEAGRPVRKPLQ
jgi:hypothetical protein